MFLSRFPGIVLVGGVSSVMALAVTPVLSGPAAASSNRARVIRVLDGDTIDVDRNFDGRADARIRFLGIDTPERGLCHAAAATKALRKLLRHRIVELPSDVPRVGTEGRLERRVVLPVGGKKIDVAEWELERGLGVWMPRIDEPTHSLAQHRAADRAAATHRGWFDPDQCGVGPFAEDPLSMQVEYLSDATTWQSAAAKRNQEFVRIRNDGPTPVTIDGWTLRAGNDRSLRVPPGGPIPPGGAVEIHVGSGTNTLTDRYLGQAKPMLANASIDGGPHLGTGSYLIDPQDDIRAHLTWPCTFQCADPTGDNVVLSEVSYDPPGNDSHNINGEYVRITNRGTTPVRTGDMVLEVWPYVYEFPTEHFLAPGQSVTVHAGQGQDSQDTRFLGSPRYSVMQNPGGRVLLRTYDAIVVDCFRWGSGTCPPGT